jgi:hypothetical protein
VARSIDPLSGGDQVNFGDLPRPLTASSSRALPPIAAITRAPTRCFDKRWQQRRTSCRPIICLYKIHTYRGHLDEAMAVARAGLQEAARQAGWSLDWRDWSASIAAPEGAARFALYTLKAMAFIHLRRNEPEQATLILDGLARLDPRGTVGWPVVAALADAVT